jgi:hypothetical protein
MSYEDERMCTIYFKYIGEDDDDEIKNKGFVGCFEEPHSGYVYNLALVKCIHE